MATHAPFEPAEATARPAAPPIMDSWTFPARSRSAGEARRRVGWCFAPILTKTRHDDLCVVVGEVMANAIQHSSDALPVELRVAGHESFVRIEITNTGPGLAPRPGATTPSHDGGFGLFLLERLAREWGMTRQHEQTQVWFEFDYV